MKRLCSLIILVFVLIINCSAKEKTVQTKPNKNIETVSIIGKVEIYNNKSGYDVYIVVNWKTRSKVSYKVINKKAKDLKNYKDAIVKAKGIILKQHSIWSKDIKVLSFKTTK